MSRRNVIITGGCGFLGVAVAQRLLERYEGIHITVTDIVKSERMNAISRYVDFIKADIAEPAACNALITNKIDAVYHFASLVSGGAEKDFESGFRANITATINLFEACRKQGTCPAFIFTSSIATFGGSSLPSTVDDWTYQHPQNSYGVAKVLGEQLLNDYSRKGYIDGRGIRLPAIVVRDEANTAASGYASSLIREPLKGNDYICPVPQDTRIPILSVEQCTNALISLGELQQGGLGDYRTINGPSISPSAGEIAEAVMKSGKKGTGKIKFIPDPQISAIIKTWPAIMRHERAKQIKLIADKSIDEIIGNYLLEKG